MARQTILDTDKLVEGKAKMNANFAELYDAVAALQGGTPAPMTLALSGDQSIAEGQSGVFTVTRTGDTSRPCIVNYTTQGTGSNPVVGADHPGGSFPTGQLTIGVGATTGNITIAAASDSESETSETGSLTITSSTENVTISAATSKYTFTNVSGGGNTFGPSDVNSPPAFNTEITANYVQFTFRTGAETLDLYVGGSASTIGASSGDSVMMQMSGDNIWIAYTVRNGSKSQIGTPYGEAPANGQKVRFEQNPDQSVDLIFGNTVVKSYSAAVAWPTGGNKTPGTWGRLDTTFSNGGATQGVTIGPAT